VIPEVGFDTLEHRRPVGGYSRGHDIWGMACMKRESEFRVEIAKGHLYEGVKDRIGGSQMQGDVPSLIPDLASSLHMGAIFIPSTRPNFGT
jgi:hypothetical protein